MVLLLAGGQIWAVLLACYCVLLAWHLKHKGHQIPSWHSLVVYFRRTPKECNTDALDSWVQKQMDQSRVRNAEKAIEIMTVASSMLIMLCLLLFRTVQTHNARIEAGWLLPSFVASLLIIYSFLLFIVTRQLQLTTRLVKSVYVGVAGLLMLRLWLAREAPLLNETQGARIMMRAFLGLFVLDWKVSSKVNAVWTVTMMCLGRNNVITLILEVICYFFMQTFLYFAESCMRSHLRLNIRNMLATNVQQAFQSLLSVLCDAEVELTPGLEITTPSYKVCQLLSPDLDTSQMDGRSFMDFVAEEDRDRCRAFLKGTQDPDSSFRPPTSLQLHICSGQQQGPIPAELFQAQLPAVDSQDQPSGHIIGIRTCNDSQQELPNWKQKGPAFGPGKPVSLEAYARRQGMGLADDVSSLASSRSSTVVNVGLPELQQCEIQFYPLDSAMTIKEVRCCFQKEDESGTKLEPPSLKSFFHGSCRDDVWAWAQEMCNKFWVGEEEFQPLPRPAVLQMPGALGDSAHKFQAEDVTVSFTGNDEESDEDEEEESNASQTASGAENDEIVGTMVLRNIQQLSHCRRRKVQSVRRLGAIQERSTTPG